MTVQSAESALGAATSMTVSVSLGRAHIPTSAHFRCPCGWKGEEFVAGGNTHLGELTHARRHLDGCQEAKP